MTTIELTNDNSESTIKDNGIVLSRRSPAPSKSSTCARFAQTSPRKNDETTTEN